MGRTEFLTWKRLRGEPWLAEQKQKQKLQRERNGARRSARISAPQKYLTPPTLLETPGSINYRETVSDEEELFELLQLRVLRLGFLQDGDVGVGVFPERQEILVSGLCFGGFAGDGISTGQLETGERAEQEVLHDSGMVEK